MAFPTIPTSAASRNLVVEQADTSGTRTFPSLTSLTKNSGDLLIAIIAAYETGATDAAFSSWGGGFTEFMDKSATSTCAIGAAYKFSTGSETGTFTVTQASVTGHAVMWLMSIAGAHASAAPEGTGTATGTNSNADSPSHTASWGSDDNLWIAVADVGETSTAGAFQGVIGSPSGYGDELRSAVSADVVGGVQGSVAFLQSAVATEDPAAWNTDTSNARWRAATIAVRPAAAVNLYLPSLVMAPYRPAHSRERRW